MAEKGAVFEKNYQGYLSQLGEVSFEAKAPRLGGRVDGNMMKISLLGKSFFISGDKITDETGRRPSYDICVILSKYILLCPETAPEDNALVSFKDFKDSGPLTTYFANDVERAIALHFKGKPEILKKAGQALSGYVPDLEVNYDIALQFDALPEIPVILLFNDEDDEFPAKSAVLFERRTEDYLDAECIAMLGFQLFKQLKTADKTMGDK